MSQNPNKPVKEFRRGAIKVSIWKNETDDNGRTVVRYSVKLNKRFHRKDGDWQDTDYYFPEDLPVLAKLIDKAFEFACDIQASSPSEVEAAAPATPFDSDP